MALHQYIGARYVPYYYENSLDPTSTEWEPNVEYEALTVVTLPNQHSYISKKTVPDTVGSPALNADYWLDTGSDNAYIQNLQDQIDAIVDELTLAKTSAKNPKMLLFADSYGMTPNASTHWTDEIIALYPDSQQSSTPAIGFVTETALDPTLCFIEKLKDFYNNMTADERLEISDIVVCGGWNDARQLHMGYKTETDLVNAINAFIAFADTNFPNAIVHIGFIAWGSSDNTNEPMPISYLNSACACYENTRKSNARVLNGVGSVMRNTALLDSTYFHPNTTGGEVLGKAILRAMYGGFTYKYMKSLSNSDVTWLNGNTGTVAGFMEVDDDLVTIYILITGMTANSGLGSLLEFKDNVLPWGHHVNLLVDCFDNTHDKSVFTAIQGRELVLYATGGSTTWTSTGQLVIKGAVNGKYN